MEKSLAVAVDTERQFTIVGGIAARENGRAIIPIAVVQIIWSR